ncbi:hypothetical protein PV328_011244 [Microctonus aethiopoides]|uniref:Uncharacterized protein n=1 Tax=Microctonus aethiopoides TaxID=144406 RepID=A0AA39C4L6_9HYME|nr:hypothetical protein PV328_011244 [Microctonus aethiopoides]
MINYLVLFGVIYGMQVTAQQSFGIKPSNILGGPEQHASFSFIRPGLTQTSFSFNGPSSHQAFSSSIGNPQLAHRVLPNVANALSYRNPGLGYVTNGPIPTAYAPSQHLIGSQIATPQLSYNQLSLDQAMALGYLQHGQSDLYQNQLNQLLALRQTQSLQFPVHQSQPHLSTHQSQVNCIYYVINLFFFLRLTTRRIYPAGFSCLLNVLASLF